MTTRRLRLPSSTSVGLADPHLAAARAVHGAISAAIPYAAAHFKAHEDMDANPKQAVE